MLLDIWGRGAMSLGTTAVERAWWPDHVRNMNRTARWATSAWRQYRAVVAWKQDVIAILRKVEEPLRKGRSGSKFLHSLEQTLALLQGRPREPLRLGKAAGKLARSDRPRRPERGEVCPGRCLHLDLELAEDEGLP